MLGGGLQDVAHAGTVRDDVRECASKELQATQLAGQTLQLLNSFLDGFNLAIEDCSDKTAGCLTLVTQCKDLAYVVESDAEGPCKGHESQALNILVRVDTVSGCLPLGFWQHAD